MEPQNIMHAVQTYFSAPSSTSFPTLNLQSRSMSYDGKFNVLSLHCKEIQENIIMS